MRTRLSATLAILASASLAFAAGSWPGFRGRGDGVSDSKALPTQWAERGGKLENVRWKTPLHGRGWSSPVALGDQIWVTTADEVIGEKGPPMKGGAPANPVKEASYFAVCIDRATGKVVHDVKLRTEQNPAYCHPFNSYASPTPFAEEGRLYAHFGSHGTFCVDTNTGDVLWKRIDLKCDHFRGPASSLAVYGDLLYLIFDGFDVQYVAALDKKTGQTKWKTDRNIKYPSNNGDMRKGYATPALLTINGKPELVCPSAECTIAYDPLTGAELWRFTHGGMNGSSRPILADGLLYIDSGSNGKLFALKPEKLTGNVSRDAVAWEATKDVCVRPFVVIANGLVFMVSDKGIASCLDAKTGKLEWRERLDGEFSASPIFAGGNVYFCGQVGKTYVVKADREYTPVAENRLADGFMASPAVAGNDLILRTTKALYCIGKK
jgi:outer membrane protein assembly factor BamB